MTRLHRHENGEYRATTPAGNEVEIYRTPEWNGWAIRRTDGTLVHEEEAIYEATLRNVRETIAAGFAD